MIKFIITESSHGGKFDCKGSLAVEETEPVHPTEIEGMLETFTGEAFQPRVKSLLRKICRKHDIPVGTIRGL